MFCTNAPYFLTDLIGRSILLMTGFMTSAFGIYRYLAGTSEGSFTTGYHMVKTAARFPPKKPKY